MIDLLSSVPTDICGVFTYALCLWHNADAFVRVGNRTECALLELCAKLGVELGPLQQAHQIVQVYPFSSDRKRMTSITFQTGAS